MNENEAIKKLNEAEEYVRQHTDIIRKAYGNKYIAVYSNVIVDNDKDEFELDKRIFKKFPKGSVILISRLEDILSPKEDLLSSPETES